nr:type II toxin-antitoxin system ParD family antitoxin [Lichenifustis flavocetrariae]
MPELERSVIAWVVPGRDRTASEIFRAALRLLDREEPLDACGPPSKGAEGDDHAGPGR